MNMKHIWNMKYIPWRINILISVMLGLVCSAAAYAAFAYSSYDMFAAYVALYTFPSVTPMCIMYLSLPGDDAEDERDRR